MSPSSAIVAIVAIVVIVWACSLMTSTGDIPGIPSHRSRIYEEGMGALQGEKKKVVKARDLCLFQRKTLKITSNGV